MIHAIIFSGLVVAAVAWVAVCEAVTDWYWGRQRTRTRILRCAQNDRDEEVIYE